MRIVVAVVAFLSAFGLALAQGRVNFNNTAIFPTLADRRVYDPAVQALVGTGWVAQLYYGPDANSLSPVSDPPLHFRVPTTSWPGTWNAEFRTLPGFGNGDTVTLQVRVWDSLLFPTYEAAVASLGVVGRSDPFLYTVPLSTPTDTSEWMMDNLRAFSLAQVPEPGSWLVLGLGLVIFRTVGRQRVRSGAES